MQVDGILLAVVKKPYDFIAQDGVNKGQRMSGINFIHYVLKNDDTVAELKLKQSAVPFSKENLLSLPRVLVNYTTFKNSDGDEVLKPESVVAI
jgi:hypothetical protein